MASVNQYGFIEAPYRVVDKETTTEVTDEIHYLTADEEEMMVVAQANEPLTEDGHFVNAKVASRGVTMETSALMPREKIDYMDVSPKHGSLSCDRDDPVPGERRREPRIDGLQHAASGCTAVGTRRRRSSVPVWKPRRPLTPASCVWRSMPAWFVDADSIVIRRDDNDGKDVYHLTKFKEATRVTATTRSPSSTRETT